jgi:hypothetical protein
MKNLILGDCNHLIKFILFGDEKENEIKEERRTKEKKEEWIKLMMLGDEIKEKKEELVNFILFGEEKEKEKDVEVRRLHIPRGKLWPEERFINGDDLDLDAHEKPERLESNMELAIYHCRGKFKLIWRSVIHRY